MSEPIVRWLGPTVLPTPIASGLPCYDVGIKESPDRSRVVFIRDCGPMTRYSEITLKFRVADKPSTTFMCRVQRITGPLSTVRSYWEHVISEARGRVVVGVNNISIPLASAQHIRTVKPG